jgi:hypothetical protein
VAKIGNLQVTKLKIAESAITGFAEGTNTLTVVNSYGMPLQVFARGQFNYSNVASGQGTGTITFNKTAGGGALFGTENAPTFVGAIGNKTATISMAFVDLNALSGSHSYEITTTVTVSGSATASWGSFQIYAVYEKV